MLVRRLLIGTVLLTLTACGAAATPTPTSAPSPVPPTDVPATAAATEASAPAAATEAIAPAATAAAAASGATVIWAFVPSQQSQTVLDNAQALADLVSTKSGYKIKILVPTDYTSAIEAMCSGEAQMGSLNTFSYIIASSRKCATVAAVSIRSKSTSYRSQFITKADSGIKAIADLKGKTFCRPDPLSTSGWIIPSITLKANGIDPTTDLKQVLDAGGHDAVVKQVYSGACDAGATFDDARTLVIKDLPDVNDKVVVFQYSSPIPNDSVSFATTFDPAAQATIGKALLDVAADPANAALLTKVYQWDGLQAATDSFFDDFRQQLDSAGVKVDSLIPPKPAATAAATMAATTGS